MNHYYTAFPADLIFTRSKRPLGAAIRWFERSAGEPPAYTNHTAGVGPDGVSVIEAMWHTQEVPLESYMVDEPVYQIWRRRGLPHEARVGIAHHARAYVGRHYGWWKLFPHLVDGFLGKIFGGNIYAVRRILFLKRYPICSWVWAYAYAEEGIGFGCPKDCADPDTQHDFVSESPDWWLVFEKGAKTWDQ